MMAADLPEWVHTPEADDFSDRLTAVFVEMIEDCQTDTAASELMRKYLGRKNGLISGFSRGIPGLPRESRPAAGRYYQNLLSLATHYCSQEP